MVADAADAAMLGDAGCGCLSSTSTYPPQMWQQSSSVSTRCALLDVDAHRSRIGRFRVGLGMVRSCRRHRAAARPTGVATGQRRALWVAADRRHDVRGKDTTSDRRATTGQATPCGSGLGVDRDVEHRSVPRFLPVLDRPRMPVCSDTIEWVGVDLGPALDDCGPATGAAVACPRFPQPTSVRGSRVDRQRQLERLVPGGHAREFGCRTQRRNESI